ncbi:peptidoglycan DD-metalloendopeptidase family protein [Xanthomonas sp. XNM01]|uniref:peptidoglycan DD-metalloendopeptidase family protein n=1 Tax=Xanthomonas sp. XNM01 TaxID=2769289 RepID=UPI00177AAD36|nr:peptidoglycan DD-metalloendopeptidase family protein [Xanthomonas sp. XNM01]MBD9367465.1 peptidoglycan DD-metalloendopeptidase family protein [Xanthomonas sp. XNM01]
MTETRRIGPAGLALVGLLALVLAACSSTVTRTPAASGASPSAGSGNAGSVVVQRGDTLYSIARRHGQQVADVARWNRLQPPYTIYPGQRLTLSGSGQAATAARPAPTAGSTPAARPAAPAATPPRPATPAPAPAPASSGFAWRWPAEGVLINGFVAGDNTRQGIDIGGNSGQAVNAAADGVVVYSGAGLVGYGELIIVKHNEQWLSAYGHNRKRLVNEGQNVKAGQQIAEMGRTGAARDMLHFEIRHNGKPVDPLPYLPKR